MDDPRQLGTIGSFVNACSELEPSLRIYASQPWTHRSRAVATVALHARPPAGPQGDDARIAAAFGDDDADDLPFFVRVAELQPLVKRLRKDGVAPGLPLCLRVLAILRDARG